MQQIAPLKRGSKGGIKARVMIRTADGKEGRAAPSTHLQGVLKSTVCGSVLNCFDIECGLSCVQLVILNASDYFRVALILFSGGIIGNPYVGIVFELLKYRRLGYDR